MKISGKSKKSKTFGHHEQEGGGQSQKMETGIWKMETTIWKMMIRMPVPTDFPAGSQAETGTGGGVQPEAGGDQGLNILIDPHSAFRHTSAF